jgi:transcriptional regulator with XRE-family HTH domain
MVPVMPPTPVYSERRHLAARLRRLREQNGRTLTEVAANFGWSDAKLSRIETGITGVREGDLAKLLTLYRVPEAQRRQYTTLATQARQRARWDKTFGDSLSDAYASFIAYEAEATSILGFEPQVFPGILQTAEYASAVMRRSVLLEGPDAVGQGVSARLARQAVLVREPPPQLSVVIDEAVIRREVGGPDVMRRQLLRLLEASERPNTTIQVLPFSAGAHPGVAGSFEILAFGDESVSPVVYCEDLTGGVIRDSPTDLRNYHRAFEVLRSTALGPEETNTMLQSFAIG